MYTTDELRARLGPALVTQAEVAKLLSLSPGMVSLAINNPDAFPVLADQIFDLLEELARENGFKLVAV